MGYVIPWKLPGNEQGIELHIYIAWLDPRLLRSLLFSINSSLLSVNSFVSGNYMTTFKLFGAEISAPKEREDEIPPLSQLPCAILHTNRGMKERGRVLVMRKTLTRSDVSVHQSRLFIINSKVLWSQLLEEEQKKVKAKEHVEVEVVDPKGGRTRMKLRRWQSLNILVLNSGWVKLVKVNKLEAKVHRIELWTFRMGDKLCFDLNVERQRQYHP